MHEQGRAQASAQAGIDEFKVQMLGELGGVARKVDALLLRADGELHFSTSRSSHANSAALPSEYVLLVVGRIQHQSGFR